jgi:hypothetical protein
MKHEKGIPAKIPLLDLNQSTFLFMHGIVSEQLRSMMLRMLIPGSGR